jgi:hypothetical protein
MHVLFKLRKGFDTMGHGSFVKTLLLLLCFGLFLPSSLPAEVASPAKKLAAQSTIQRPAYSESFTVDQLRSFAFEALRSAYPDFDFKLVNGKLVFPDGTSLTFDDELDRSPQALLDSPDILDMFFYRYPSLAHRKNPPATPGTAASDPNDGALTLPTSLPYLEDPGRIRNESFFRIMYGSTEETVKRRLAPVKWIPSGKGSTMMVTTVNGVNKALQAVSDELDKLPELWPYLLRPGGSFTWRPIAGTNRLSVHSFGAAVDINVGRSNYWRDAKQDEEALLDYKNRIPAKIVEVFERHGFIWGGWWYHYDTMHFEYRPELIAYMKTVEYARAAK